MTLCLIIPTYNRPSCIEYYLSAIQHIIKQNSIAVIIYDSSDNDETKNVVNKYRKSNKNVFYDRYVHENQINAIDLKVYTAYQKYCLKYDFMWFCGDSAVLKLEKYYNEIQLLAQRDYDMIVTDCKDCLEGENKEYESPLELFGECFWFMTLLSSVIVSGRMAKNIIARHPFSEGQDNYLWLPCVYFDELINDTYRVIHYSNNDIYGVNPKATESFWRKQKNAIWQWSTVYCQAIDSLSCDYDTIKPRVLKSFDHNMQFFSLIGLLRFKEDGNLTFRKVKENEAALKRVTSTSKILFYIVAALPIRRLLTTAKKTIKYLKGKSRRKEK